MTHEPRIVSQIGVARCGRGRCGAVHVDFLDADGHVIARAPMTLDIAAAFIASVANAVVATRAEAFRASGCVGNA